MSEPVPAQYAETESFMSGEVSENPQHSADGVRQEPSSLTPSITTPSAEYVAPDECSHSWRTCPVHSTGTDEMPSFATVVTCIYGGAELKDGGTWNEGTSKEVLARMWARIGGTSDE